LKAVTLADTLRYFQVLSAGHHNLNIAYKKLNKWKESEEQFEQYIVYRDSMINKENTKKIVEAQMNFEFSQKEAATKADQDKKDALAVQEKKKQQIILVSVSSGMILLLVLAVVIFRSLRLNQKKNKIISLQKELVEKQKNMVEEKQTEILDSIHYANRIQRALITSEKYIEKQLERLGKDA